jgi:chromosome segregation ATPase
MAEGSDADAARQIDELMRINGELAAEIRSLQAGRATAARSGGMPAARRVGVLREEHDSALAELDRLRAELHAAEAEQERLERHNQELGQQIHEQNRQIASLHAGFVGLLVRARTRLGRGRAET